MNVYRLKNVGNWREIRTRTQKIKLSKLKSSAQTMTSQKKINFLEKVPSLKRWCFRYLYHWFKRDHQHLEFEWRMNIFFSFIETKLDTDLLHLSNARLQGKETPTGSWKDSWKFVYSLAPTLYFTQSNRFLFEMPQTATSIMNWDRWCYWQFL